MSTRRACLACRARKVKCILGPNPRCERCTAKGLEDCVYESIKKRGVGNTLRMGQACRFCRIRKRKCDAKRPCTSCIKARRATECEYEIDDVPTGPSDHSQLSFWDDPDPSRSTDAHGPWAVGEMVSGSPTNLPPNVTEIQMPSEIVPPARALIRPPAYNCLLSYTPPEPRPRTFDKIRTHIFVTLPPFSAISSTIFPSIPPQPHVASSSPGTGRFQLSNAALGDLNMKFRLKILCRLNKFGIRLTSQKQQALLRGDTSGAIIHPFFVYSAQAFGMYFCEGMDNSPAMIRLRAEHAQMSSDSLVGILKICDCELVAQAAVLVIAGSIILRLNEATRLYIQRSSEAINAAKLQFIPTYGQPPEYSEGLHERLSALSQIIYFENFLFLVCGWAEPTVTTRIEMEFRHQLRKVYPVLFKICPLTMRTQAILLVRDTVLTLNLRPIDEARLVIWRQSCDQLVTLLDEYSQTLLSNLQRFSELGDTSGAGMIRASCVICLAHLAVLCEALSKIEPTPQTELDTLWDSTLEQLGALARDMCMEEYTLLDLLLKVSWKKALEVFEARLAGVPLEHSTGLRHWRGIVARVHSDFAAKLPDAGAELPTLATQENFEDDRTEGSRHQNLMLPGVK